jgi:hypothetical protein
MSRLDRELAALFGRALVSEATSPRPIAIDWTPACVAAVHTAVDTLLERSGNPQAQRRIIHGLDVRTSLALCRWVKDPTLAAKLAAGEMGG